MLAICVYTRCFFVNIVGGKIIFRRRKISVRKNHSFSLPKIIICAKGIPLLTGGALPSCLTVFYHKFVRLSIVFRTVVRIFSLNYPFLSLKIYKNLDFFAFS